ncbi:MAG: PxKF domain-containing protein [Pyrinomonadaceae bacterium]
MKAITRARFFILLVAVLSLPLISAASASYVRRSLAKSPALTAAVTEAAAPRAASPAGASRAVGFQPILAAMPFQAGPESITIYQSDCTTPATDFNIGQGVCAKLTGAPTGSRVTQLLRSLVISGPDGFIRSKISVPGNSSIATLTFTLPGMATSAVGGGTVDNRGTWQAASLTNDGAPVVLASFRVTDPAEQVAQLVLSESASASEVAPGSNVTFRGYLNNVGPNDAADVVFTAVDPVNTSLVSASAGTGSGFTCQSASGETTCSADSLPRGTTVAFTLSYDVSAPAGSVVVSNTSVATSTVQRSTRDNSASVAVSVTTAAAPTVCNLTCPANVVATANTTVGGNFGAFVTFSSASVSGDCGAVSNSPASGTFFTVGTHTVTASAPGENGATGDSCTFTVKVVDTPAPTISCPADKLVVAASGADDATVPGGVGTPTFTASGSGATIHGVRSDSIPAVYDDEGNLVSPAQEVPLTDPYPVGVTGITWTVTDADGRTASCQQKVTVSTSACGSDTTPPTITAPDDVTAGTGSVNPGCTVTLDDELGQPEVNDNCAVTITVTGAPAGNNFAPGTYTLTYTATDGAGNAASDTQVVTVVDNTPPIIAAPPDAAYTCLEAVPAANVNQAKGPVVGADGQFVRDTNGELVFSGPPFENCGTVNVSVNESATGVGSAANPRIITRTYTANDNHGNSASAVQTITVTDGTPPTITAPANVTAYTGPGAVSCDAVVSNATLGTASASDNCAGVTVARSPTGNTFPVGTTTVTWTATDAVGNTATATQQVTVIDNTPPVITPPADVVVYLPLNSTATSRTVTYPNPATATDNCGGSISIGYSPASGSVFPVGPTTVTITATDSHGNSSTATFTVTVLYNFTGFFSPVDNPPTLNVVNAGRAIPVKFSLSGNKGLGIFAADSPYTVAINCDGSAPQSDVTETVNAGSSSLSYNSGSDQYNYVWKTDSSWANTCRQLVVKLNDGSTHTANFKFK